MPRRRRPIGSTVAVNDQGLRNLSRSLAADGTLDRADWLRLFTQVQADGTVSGAEYNDLGDLLHPSRVTFTATVGFTLPAAIRVLAGKVVDGNAANARFQGGALGNLQSGSAAGAAAEAGRQVVLRGRPPRGRGRRRPTASVGGALFVNGISYTDVAQGAVGDCYLVAALAGIARFSPQTIQQMFTDNGDGTFTVRFYRNGVADYVTVDRSLADQLQRQGQVRRIRRPVRQHRQRTVGRPWRRRRTPNSTRPAGSGTRRRTRMRPSTAAIPTWPSNTSPGPTPGGSGCSTPTRWTWSTRRTAGGTPCWRRRAGRRATASSPATGTPWSASTPRRAGSPCTTRGARTIELTWWQVLQSFNGFWQMGL